MARRGGRGPLRLAVPKVMEDSLDFVFSALGAF